LPKASSEEQHLEAAMDKLYKHFSELQAVVDAVRHTVSEDGARIQRDLDNLGSQTGDCLGYITEDIAIIRETLGNHGLIVPEQQMNPQTSRPA
jgi:hypothetical protein